MVQEKQMFSFKLNVPLSCIPITLSIHNSTKDVLSFLEDIDTECFHIYQHHIQVFAMPCLLPSYSSDTPKPKPFLSQTMIAVVVVY